MSAPTRDVSYREEEKDKFFGYMDLAFSKLTGHGLLVFAISKEKLPVKDMTKEEFTELELPTPMNQEREECWKYFSKNYSLAPEVDLLEMATKFLFTPGKIKSALHQARSFATMDREIVIPRDTLFKGCNNQMSSELTQKATKVKANFGFEDIVMNRDQRETLEHAIDQMNFRKQVYEEVSLWTRAFDSSFRGSRNRKIHVRSGNCPRTESGIISGGFVESN